MNERDRRTARPVVTATVVAALTVIVYASWLSGVRSFSTPAWVGTAVPAVLLLAVALPPLPRPRRDHDMWPIFSHSVPLLGLLVIAVVLEAVGLALGGRSSAVPTLSTVVDHALEWRATRALLVVLWLAVGFGPVVLRLHRRYSQVRPEVEPGSPP